MVWLANVEIRAFTGGNHYERAESTSEWVKIKGPQTTPNSPPTVASPIADIGPLVVGDGRDGGSVRGCSRTPTATR